MAAAKNGRARSTVHDRGNKRLDAVLDFIAFSVKGPLDFALTGVLAELLAPLAAAEISVFTLSTFDTDWILVPGDKADEAAEVWRRSGHEVTAAVPAKPPRKKR